MSTIQEESQKPEVCVELDKGTRVEVGISVLHVRKAWRWFEHMPFCLLWFIFSQCLASSPVIPFSPTFMRDLCSDFLLSS